MEIVIEYVLLDNFLIDALIMILALKTLKLPISKWGIVLAASFGAGFAVVSPLIPVSGILAILLKLAVAFVMCFMACFTFKKIFLRFCIFVIYTFAFGGALIALFTFMNVQVYDAMYLGYVSELPLGALLVAIIMFFVGVFRFINNLYKRRVWTNSLPIKIKIRGKEKQVKGFVDTGNTLRNHEGVPVIVLPEKQLAGWFDAHERIKIMFGKADEVGLNNVEMITVGSLGGSYKMCVFDALVTIDGLEQKACVGVANGRVRCGDCQAIIGSDLLEAVKC